MPKVAKPLRRVQLDMTESQMARLNWLMEQTDSMTMSEEIRASLKLREQLVNLQRSGKVIYAIDANGNKTHLLS